MTEHLMKAVQADAAQRRAHMIYALVVSGSWVAATFGVGILLATIEEGLAFIGLTIPFLVITANSLTNAIAAVQDYLAARSIVTRLESRVSRETRSVS